MQSIGAGVKLAAIETLASVLADEDVVIFAVLIGSRADDSANEKSDWDIALRFQSEMSWVNRLSYTEILRHRLAKEMGVLFCNVDLIDIQDASLAMRAVVAEEGVPLKGEEDLAWSHFLLRTWRELETFYWRKIYAS